MRNLLGKRLFSIQGKGGIDTIKRINLDFKLILHAEPKPVLNINKDLHPRSNSEKMIPETVQKSTFHFEKDLRYQQKPIIRLKDGSIALPFKSERFENDHDDSEDYQMKSRNQHENENENEESIANEKEKENGKGIQRQKNVENVILNVIAKEVYNKDSTTHWLIKKPIWRVSRIVNFHQDGKNYHLKIYWILEDHKEAYKYKDQLEYLLKRWEPFINCKIVPLLPNLKNAPQVTFCYEEFKNEDILTQNIENVIINKEKDSKK